MSKLLIDNMRLFVLKIFSQKNVGSLDFCRIFADDFAQKTELLTNSREESAKFFELLKQ